MSHEIYEGTRNGIIMNAGVVDAQYCAFTDLVGDNVDFTNVSVSLNESGIGIYQIEDIRGKRRFCNFTNVYFGDFLSGKFGNIYGSLDYYKCNYTDIRKEGLNASGIYINLTGKMDLTIDDCDFLNTIRGITMRHSQFKTLDITNSVFELNNGTANDYCRGIEFTNASIIYGVA
ncbi:MAG: hypothetical protein R2766_08530 [Saprospiraceae bacterium]